MILIFREHFNICGHSFFNYKRIKKSIKSKTNCRLSMKIPVFLKLLFLFYDHKRKVQKMLTLLK